MDFDIVNKITSIPKNISNSISDTKSKIDNIRLGIERMNVERITRDMGIHECTEHAYIDISGCEPKFSIIIGNDGLIQHSHKVAVVKRKDLIISLIGDEYEKYFKFAFVLEDTLFHNHDENALYFCMDDGSAQFTSIYYIILQKTYDSLPIDPILCHRSVEDISHSHTLTVIRYPPYDTSVASNNSDRSIIG